jgi:heptosyltransferase III
MRRLLIRSGAIGDCILSFPVLCCLKAEYTEVWVPTAIVPIIQFADKVSSIASTGIDLLGLEDATVSEQLRTRLQSFDQIVSWYGSNRPEFRAALESYGVPCVFHRALPGAGDHCHATDFFALQVCAPIGLFPTIEVGSHSPRNSVVVQPFSGSAKKNWPLMRYRELASRLSRNVEWLAGPEEHLPGAIKIPNLMDLARFIKGASLFIGNDSGATHLAAATGVPTLALFGPTSPEIWAPRNPNTTIIQRSPIDDLSVAEVLSAANRLLCSR